MRDLAGEARFLRARRPGGRAGRRRRRSGPGRSSSSTSAQVVGTVETLDDDAFDAQVVAPHLLDQLGVVHAFHQDPRRARDRGARADDGAAARRRARRRGDARVRQMRGARLLRRRRERGGPRCRRPRTRPAWLGNRRVEPGLAAQHDVGTVELHQLAREPGGAVQHAETGPRRFGRVRGGGALGAVDRAREDAVDGSWPRIHRRNGTRGTSRDPRQRSSGGRGSEEGGRDHGGGGDRVVAETMLQVARDPQAGEAVHERPARDPDPERVVVGKLVARGPVEQGRVDDLGRDEVGVVGAGRGRGGTSPRSRRGARPRSGCRRARPRGSRRPPGRSATPRRGAGSPRWRWR